MTDIANLVVRAKADGVALVDGQLKSLNTTAKDTSKAFVGMDKSVSQTVKTFARMAGAATIGVALMSAARSAMAFDKSMREISTLTTSMDIDKLSVSVRQLSKEFGADRITQAKGLYQIISAGAATAAEATDILAASNKLAIGGVTTVAIAADGLTSALNAYGKTAADAESTSDAFFVAMKAGKTTIEELASSIGSVAPIAAQTGVSLEELLAATAAITVSGMNTSMTMNALRQVIANIIKPSSEAAETAQKLGIEFNAAALKSKGLYQFLADMVEKTGGSTVALTKLIGSVEALGPVMQLISESGGRKFTETLIAMENKAGATNEAYDKMKESFDFLWQVIKQNLLDSLLQLGTMIMDTVRPAMTYLATDFDDAAEKAETLGRILLTGAIFLGIQALPGMLATLGVALVGVTTKIYLMGVAAASNPLGLILTAVALAVSAFIAFKDDLVTFGETTASVSEWFVAAWTWAFGSLGEKIGALVEKFRKMATSIGEFFEPVFKWFADNTSQQEWVGLELLKKGAAEAGAEIAALAQHENELAHALDEVVVTGRRRNDVLKGTTGAANETAAAVDALLESEENGKKGADKLVALHSKLEAQLTQTESAALGLARQMDTAVLSTITLEVAEMRAALASGELDAAATATAISLLEQQEASLKAATTADKYVESQNKAAEATARQAEQLRLAEAEADPFVKSMEGMIGRVDSAFVDTWRNIGSGFNSLKDSILNSFSQMLAEMAHMAITRPIVMSILGGATSGVAGTASAAAGGAQGVTGLLSGISSAWTLAKSAYAGAAGSMASAYESVARFAEAQGWHGVAGSAQTTAGQYSAGGWGAAGAAALNIGAGLAGSYAGRAVFQNEGSTGIGSAAGGLVGSIWGPIGTAVGSFLGEGLEKVLGDALGFGGKEGNNWGNVEFNAGRNSVGRAYGSGNWDGKNGDLATSIAEQIIRFNQVTGSGSSLTGKLSVSSRGNVRYNGAEFKADESGIEALLQVALKQVIDTSTTLSSSMKDLILGFSGTSTEIGNFAEMLVATLGPGAEISSTLKALIQKFKGTAEETSAFAVNMATFLELIKRNPVLDGVLDYTQKVSTVGEVFDAQTQVVGKLIASYDGSLSSIEAVTAGYATMQQMAYEFTAMILAAGDAVRALTTTTAEGFRQSVMTDEQLFASWTQERDGLATALRTMTDPTQIQDTVARITELSVLMYNALPDADKIAGASETYARYIENIGTIATEQLNKVLGNVWVEMENMNAVAAAAMSSAATTIDGSVSSFSAHVTTFGNSVASLKAAVDELVRNGIPVRVTNASRSEIGV